MSNVSGMGAVNINSNINKPLIDRDRSVRRWKPIIENMGMSHDIVILYMCLFAEYRSIQINDEAAKIANSSPTLQNSIDLVQSDLPNDLKDMVQKLSENVGRIKLKDQSAYYNVIKNTIEYELENGEFVTSQKLSSGNYNNHIAEIEILSIRYLTN